MAQAEEESTLAASIAALSATSAEASTLSRPPRLKPHPQSLPAITSRSFTVDGVATDIWIQLFEDRSVVACSQLTGGRIGSWLLCKRTVPDIFSPHSTSKKRTADTEVSHVLGATQRDDPLLQVYAKQVTEAIATRKARLDGPTAAATTTTTLLLGLSLDPNSSKDPAVFRTIVNLLGNVYQEAILAARR